MPAVFTYVKVLQVAQCCQPEPRRSAEDRTPADRVGAGATRGESVIAANESRIYVPAVVAERALAEPGGRRQAARPPAGGAPALHRAGGNSASRAGGEVYEDDLRLRSLGIAPPVGL